MDIFAESVLQLMLNTMYAYFSYWNLTVSQGRKTMFSLKSKVNQMCLNTKTMFSFLDSYVCNMLHYGCKVWGNHNDTEKLHLNFTKYVLGVKRTTTTAMSCRLPMEIIRIVRIFKFWFKLVQTNDCILKMCYNI